MAQVSKFCNGTQNAVVSLNPSKSHQPKSVFSVSFRPQSKGCSSYWGLNHNVRLSNHAIRTARVSASVDTAEKPSSVSEITLQPIKEISGTIKLPGSKSLSNRILLLAALSEVLFFFFLFKLFN